MRKLVPVGGNVSKGQGWDRFWGVTQAGYGGDRGHFPGEACSTEHFRWGGDGEMVKSA